MAKSTFKKQLSELRGIIGEINSLDVDSGHNCCASACEKDLACTQIGQTAVRFNDRSANAANNAIDATVNSQFANTMTMLEMLRNPPRNEDNTQNAMLAKITSMLDNLDRRLTQLESS